MQCGAHIANWGLDSWGFVALTAYRGIGNTPHNPTRASTYVQQFAP